MAGNTADKRVNDQRLRTMKDKDTLTESMPGRGTGSILFKRIGNTVTAYYRWNLDKKPGQISLGPYRLLLSSAGFTLAELRVKAREMVDILLSHGNPKVYLERQAAEAEALRQAEAAAREKEAKRGTFKDLLDHYCADLRDRRKVKAGEVERIFRIHVLDPFPDLAKKAAQDITDYDIECILTRVKESKPRNRGKNNTTPAPQTSMGSTTDTVHTYLSAAFEKARRNRRTIGRKAIEPKEFNVAVNVAEAVTPLSDVYLGDTRALSQQELRELLIYLNKLPERKRAIALTPLYLAGQRLQMLAELPWEYVHEDGIMLIDKKGKGLPRQHFLPLTPRIREIMAPLLNSRISPAGPIAVTENLAGRGYLIKIYSTAGRELNDAKLTSRFSWMNVRTTAETQLAGLGVSEETRAHLLSHGRSGIQAKHYDRNMYLREKIEALQIWTEHLDGLIEGKFRPDIRHYDTLSDLRNGRYK